MQSVWFSILIGSFIKRQFPTIIQIISIVVILFGTILAANILPLTSFIDWRGIILSLLAVLAYAITIQVTGNVGNQLMPITKTWLLSFGAFIIIMVI